MPFVQQAGGSLTTAIILTIIAWGVRVLRKNDKGGILPGGHEGPLKQGRFFSILSPAALRMLVETNPISHLVLDTRSMEEIQDQPLPNELSSSTLHLPFDEIASALAGENSWPTRLKHKASPPTKECLLIFLATQESQARLAASRAAENGFQHTAILDGGLEGFSQSLLSQANLKFISRDALAVLMDLSSDGHLPSEPCIVDLRRNDERTLYGTIPGTYHIQADEIAAAFQTAAKQWKERYRCEKPSRNDVVVLFCRTNKRASWAAQLAHDSGLQNCFVYKQGIYGWHMSPSIRAYRGFEKWDPPPEPEPVQILGVDVESGKAELAKLGLI